MEGTPQAWVNSPSWKNVHALSKKNVLVLRSSRIAYRDLVAEAQAPREVQEELLVAVRNPYADVLLEEVSLAASCPFAELLVEELLAVAKHRDHRHPEEFLEVVEALPVAWGLLPD